MKKRQFYTCLLIMYLGISCSPSRKSEAYFRENKTAIAELRTYFNQLYTQQPFSAGFTDKTFKYYVMQVMTDTLGQSIITKRGKMSYGKTSGSFTTILHC